jgi:hypothetical protein
MRHPWTPYRIPARNLFLGQDACAPNWPTPAPAGGVGLYPVSTEAAPSPSPTFVSPRGVNCQRTQDGGAICSDGVGYAPG